MMAVVGVGVSFLVLVFFYVGTITAQRNLSSRYEDNAVTAAGGTFPHNQSAIINPHPEVVN